MEKDINKIIKNDIKITSNKEDLLSIYGSIKDFIEYLESSIIKLEDGEESE